MTSDSGAGARSSTAIGNSVFSCQQSAHREYPENRRRRCPCSRRHLGDGLQQRCDTKLSSVLSWVDQIRALWVSTKFRIEYDHDHWQQSGILVQTTVCASRNSCTSLLRPCQSPHVFHHYSPTNSSFHLCLQRLYPL
jgi:hypothetical protein